MSERLRPTGPSLFFDQLLLPAGWARNVRLTIDDGRIATVTIDSMPQVGDERHGLGLPGMPNLHSHAFQRAIAGLTERRGPGTDSFWSWRDIMYRFVAHMSPDDVQAIAALAYMEMLEGGFTRVGEFHYLHHDCDGAPYADPAAMSGAIIAAAVDSGIGLTLSPVLYSHAGFGAQPPHAGQARFILSIDGYARLIEAAQRHAAILPDAVVGIAPHSLRAISADQLGRLTPLAKGRPIHIHIAEQVKEVEDCLAWSGQRPVAWLLDHADVDARWCLVHATHVDAGEVAAIARSGATVGLCPITEANLGDGIFPAGAYLDAGGRFGVGSDSNVLIDCAEELRLLEYGQRLLHRGRNMLARQAGEATGAVLHARALAGGAAALGVQGGIAIGLPADIVSLDAHHPALLSRTGDAITDSFIFAAGRSAIDCVWRHGIKLVQGGRHRERDAIVRTYRAVLERLIG